VRDLDSAARAERGPKRRRKPRQRLVRVLIGALSLGLFGAVLYVGGVEAWRQLLDADGRWVGVAFGCTAALTFVTATRWGTIANALAGTRLCSTRAYYHYLMMGRTAGLVLPETVAVHTVGPLTMKAGGHASFGLAFSSLLIDKLFDLGLSGLLLLPTAALALRVIDVRTCAAIFGIVFALLAVGIGAWYGPLLAWGLRVRRNMFARAARVSWLRRVLDTRPVRQILALREDQMPSRRVALTAYGLTVLRYLLMVARFAAVSQAVRIDVPPLWILVGIPIAQLGLLFSVTPGALGAMEAGWLGVLLLAGLPRAQIAAFLIAQRAAITVFILGLGGGSYLLSLLFPLQADDGRPMVGDA
jgi:uncharacterized protein (TIRG00374 family)